MLGATAHHDIATSQLLMVTLQVLANNHHNHRLNAHRSGGKGSAPRTQHARRQMRHNIPFGRSRSGSHSEIHVHRVGGWVRCVCKENNKLTEKNIHGAKMQFECVKFQFCLIMHKSKCLTAFQMGFNVC